MPSNPTALLGIELQGTGENLNTWGQKLNDTALTRLTEAIAGVTQVNAYPAVLSSTNYVANQARNMILWCTGAGGSVTIPAQSKMYLVRNASSGSVTVTAGGVGAIVAAGDCVPVMCDGTDCFKASRTDFQNAVLKNVANGAASLDAVNKQQLDAVLAAAQAYTDATAFQAASLPGQAGNAGKFLSTNGTTPSWQTALPAYAGTADYLLYSDGSQSAWGSPATIRTKLSLGGAALLNVGTAGGTVAAGNDSRIVGAAQLSGSVFVGAISGPSATFTALNGAMNGSLGGVTPAAASVTTLTASGAAALNGNVTLGDASTDVVTVKGQGRAMVIASGSADTTGVVSFGTGAAPGGLAVGAIYLQHAV